MTEHHPSNPAVNSECIVSRDEPILVTGSSGFIGTRIVETLLGYGFNNIRCFVRPSSQLGGCNQEVDHFVTRRAGDPEVGGGGRHLVLLAVGNTVILAGLLERK